MSPLLLLKVMLKDKVKALLNQALSEDESLFLIDLSMGADNSINVVLDGDQGVTVQDCMKVSRAIEHNLDREEEDFSRKCLFLLIQKKSILLQELCFQSFLLLVQKSHHLDFVQKNQYQSKEQHLSIY